MNRITKRTWFLGVFLGILIGGMGIFLWRYSVQAPEWISMAGGANSGNSTLVSGAVVDRWGYLLLETGSGFRNYSTDLLTRRSTLHWLGDRGSNIRARIVGNYAGAMAGFDRVNDTYNVSGGSGTAMLTLSARVQNTALTALSGRKGTVAVYNYKTGEILCAVSGPTFDPDNVPDIDGNDAYTGVYLNRFMQSSYTPGSVFKVVTTAAALASVPGIEDMHFTCYGRYAYGTEAVTCESAHGTLDLRSALAQSCNCAFAQIAEKVGRKNMTAYVQKFRITEPVQFDDISTVKGNYDISNTGAASFAWSCIGQHSDLINPCRYMTFMGMIAGGGKAAMPYLMEKVLCGGELTYQAKPTLSERIMDEELARRMQDYLRNNVETKYGSWQFPGLTVCGKSGTAQVSGGQSPHALFAGFVTDPQYPLAFIAVVENGGYGAAVCIPILSAVLKECKAVMDAEL